MLKFEEYLNQFSSTIDITDFLVGFLVTAILALIIRLFYIKYGSAISNRRRFANTFLPLALGTMLIITIVKSSLALSLGLVGALSIVRFRAAIKDPEELTYLFLVIGLGLSTGANQIIVAIVGIPLIIIMLWAFKVFQGKKPLGNNQKMAIHINTRLDASNDISKALMTHLDEVELRRMDSAKEGLKISFVAMAENLEQLNKVKAALEQIDPEAHISFIEHSDFAI